MTGEIFDSYLPALGIFPIQVESIKIVLLQKCDCICDEILPFHGIINQSAVLVSGAVAPTSDGKQYLGSFLLVRGHFLIELLRKGK